MIKIINEDYDYKELYGDYNDDTTEDSTKNNIPDYLVIEDGILVECIDKNVVNVDIPNGVTEIGYRAFQNCKSLESVNIPNGVKEIGKEAFSNCTSLQSINIPDSVTEIGIGAFWNCPNLTLRMILR